MTTDQAIKRMIQNTDANNWDLIYNWVKQGELQNKTFKKLMEKLLKDEKEKQESFYQDKYAENRRLMQEEFLESQQVSNPGGGKKKKAS